jgi:lipopolysaccharide export system permease protein
MARVVHTYLRQQIYWAAGFALIGFVGLFMFFDLIAELGSIAGRYTIALVGLKVALSAPLRMYELMPVAVLIGAIYIFSQLASHSEFTILRVAGLTGGQSLLMLFKMGLPIVLLTFFLGEGLSPQADEWAERLRLEALGSTVSSQFRSGVWVKDRIIANHQTGQSLNRFVNVGRLSADQTIHDVKIYEFDEAFRLNAIRQAKTGHFIFAQNNKEFKDMGEWLLENVEETQFNRDSKGVESTRSIKSSQIKMPSELTPQILAVLMVQPDRMSLWRLFNYVHHLQDNHQDAHSYEIAFWRKMIYPFTIFVMLMMALPFAYLHARAGAVGIKVFGGIMLGLSFVLLNTLFSHVGLLSAWPAWVTAIIPGALYGLGAIVALYWVERH